MCIRDRDIGIPVVEGREEEALYRRIHHPVADPVFNIVGFRVVKEARLRQLDRAEAAEQVFINILGSIEHFRTVQRLAGNIVSHMYEDYVIIFREIIVLDDFLVKFFKQRVVL